MKRLRPRCHVGHYYGQNEQYRRKFFFFQAEDGIRDLMVTGVQTCALPIFRHNLAGSPGTEIIPELLDPRDLVVRGKRRYSAFLATDLEFVLRRKLGADTLVLSGINTSTCVLCAAFEATNRDFRVIVAADAVDSMDGEDMHRFSMRLVAAALGWPLGNEAILQALS